MTPRWPYPSYGDRRWLGGDRGGDQALAAVVRAVRALATDSGDRAGADPPELLAGVRHVTALADRLDWALLSLVGEARTAGVSWSAIGEALGVSKQAAQQRFAPYVQQALDQVRG